MSEHITNRCSTLVPPASTLVNESDTKTKAAERAKERHMIDKQNGKLAIEATIEMLRDQRAQMKTLTDACADMSRATAEYVRRAAAARFPQTAPRPPKAPPPVSTHLRRFTIAIAEKVAATSALLTDEQRGRIAALVPTFACAALGNDPDVVAMVVRWMDLPPEDIAREMVANFDAFERRFAQ
jgi:hypothetical protein